MYQFDDSFDQNKSRWNKEHRGIDFLEARAVWDDPKAIEGPGTTKDGEERWLKRSVELVKNFGPWVLWSGREKFGFSW